MTNTDKTHPQGLTSEETNPLQRWRECLHVLNERRWIAITTFAVVVLGAAIWGHQQTPMYRAHARLQFDMSPERVLNVPNLADTGTPGYMFSQYINTQIKALRSRTFINKVATSLQSSTNAPTRDFVSGQPDLASRLSAGLTIKQVAETLLVDINVEDPDPFAVALFANAVATQFIREDVNRSTKTAIAALEWLRKQADDQKTKLATSEQAVLAYQQKSGLVSLEDRQDIVVAKLKAISTSLTEAETQLGKATSQHREVSELLEGGVTIEDIPVVREYPRVVEARAKISDSESALAALKLRYKAKHPTLLAAQAELQEARAEFSRVCEEVREGIDRTRKIAQVTTDGLRAALKQQEQQVLELNRMLVEYDELKRNAEADRELYDSILSRIKETDLAGKLDSTNIRLIDQAHQPETPFKPRKWIILAQAVAFGGVLGLLIVVIVHLMDDRVRRVDDIELGLGLPVLTMIPWIDADSPSERAMSVLNSPESQASEAFHGLLACSALEETGRKACTTMVVSAGPGEGKSLIALGLASAHAKNGESTLLIDGDLRRPSQHKLLNVGQCPGLAALLSGTAKWEETVFSSGVDNLHIMFGTGAPRDPGRLLSTAQLGNIIKEARWRYERVVIDCPPLFGVSDALRILPHVDGALFVTLYNRTQRRAMKEACQKLFDANAPIIGAVINGMERGSYSYYYHRYGYDHYYNRPPEASKKEPAP